MRLAVAQLDAARDAGAGSRDDLAALATASIARAAELGAQIVVLPEYASGWSAPLTPALVEREGGPFLTAVRNAAAGLGVAVVVGVMLPAGAPGRARNVTIVVGPDGADLGRYTKSHLYDAYGTRESDVLDAGDPSGEGGPLAVELVVGGRTLTLGVLTCYDLRFPEPFRALMDTVSRSGRRPDVIAIGAAWAAGEGKADQLRILARARAIENTVHVALASQSGQGRVGGSAVVDPAGIVLAEVTHDPQAHDGEDPAGVRLALAEIDLERVADVREVSPVLAHRRYEVRPRA